MYKYDPLGDYLRKQSSDRVTLSFDDVADIIGDTLPPSAFTRAEWWANSRSHIEANAWMDEGWKTEGTSLIEQRVTFVKQ